jgi:hypothetical protein
MIAALNSAARTLSNASLALPANGAIFDTVNMRYSNPGASAGPGRLGPPFFTVKIRNAVARILRRRKACQPLWIGSIQGTFSGASAGAMSRFTTTASLSERTSTHSSVW